jgi:adenylate cyclase
MALEIERKFLVVGEAWRSATVRTRPMRQFYLSRLGRASVRVRMEGDALAWLTIKTAASGTTRSEFEYAVPVADARTMEAFAEGSVIDKVRHVVPFAGLDWEIDVFAGDNAGLVIAEVELQSESHPLAMPPWAGEEVTHERRYYNASLVLAPFRTWAS